jgi:hypothetical protein
MALDEQYDRTDHRSNFKQSLRTPQEKLLFYSPYKNKKTKEKTYDPGNHRVLGCCAAICVFSFDHLPYTHLQLHHTHRVIRDAHTETITTGCPTQIIYSTNGLVSLVKFAILWVCDPTRPDPTRPDPTRPDPTRQHTHTHTPYKRPTQ